MRTRTLHIASAAFVAALMPGLSWAQDCTPDARRVVDAIYRQVLERDANGEGQHGRRRSSTRARPPCASWCATSPSRTSTGSGSRRARPPAR